MQESGTGLVITVGGDHGLKNKHAYDPKSAIIVSLGKPQTGRPTWKKFDACPIHAKKCEPHSELPENGTNFKLGTVEHFPIKVVIKDSDDKLYEFVVKEGAKQRKSFSYT